MPKISLKQANELLKEIGADVEVVEDDQAEKDTDITAQAENIHNGIKELVRPDIEAEIVDKTDKASVGKALDVTRQQITKQLGIPRSQLKGLSEAEMIALVKEKTSGNKDDNADAWAQEKQDIIDNYEEQLENQKTDYQTRIDDANKKYTQKNIDDYFIELANKHPRKGGELKDHASYLKYKAEQDFDIVWNEEKGVPDFLKDNIPAKSGNKAFDPDAWTKTTFEHMGVLATDTRHVTPSEIDEKGKSQKEIDRRNTPTNTPRSANAKALRDQLSSIEDE